MDEIKELRDQMAAMKNSLDNYAIINGRLMQSVMRERSKGLNRLVGGELILTPFLILFFFGICHAFGMTIWMPVTMSVACVVDALLDLKTVRVPEKLIGSLTLRDFREFLIRQKRQRALQLAIEMPLILAWVVWFLLSYFGGEAFGYSVNPVAKYVFVGAMLILVLVIVAVIYFRIQDVNTRMIQEIDAMENYPCDTTPHTGEE